MTRKKRHDEDNNKGLDLTNDAATSAKDGERPSRVSKSPGTAHSAVVPNTGAIRDAMAMAKLVNSLPRIDPAEFTINQQLLSVNLMENNVRLAFSQAHREFAQAAAQNAAMINKVVDDFRRWQDMIDLRSWSTNLLAGQKIASITAAFQSHAEVMANLTQSFQAITSLTSAVTNNLNNLVTAILPYVERLQESERARLLEAFMKVNLWPSPSMAPELIDHIIDLIDTDNIEEILPAVQAYYEDGDHANLKRAIEQWWDDPEFISRRHIIEQALQGHCQKMYALTIPALIAQTEGIASAYTLVRETSDGSKPKLGKSGLVFAFAIEDASEIAMGSEEGVDFWHTILVGAVIQYARGVAFENSDFATQYADLRQKQDLNRHGTLHGIQINYPNAMNSLRCFLLLDAMHEVLLQARATISARLKAEEATAE